jgi:hypothetical protein
MKRRPSLDETVTTLSEVNCDAMIYGKPFFVAAIDEVGQGVGKEDS